MNKEWDDVHKAGLVDVASAVTALEKWASIATITAKTKKEKENNANENN